MKQNKYITYASYFVIMILLIISLGSCKKFLSVSPRDFVFEEEAFSTPEGTRSTLNGIYRMLSSDALYGQKMTMTTVDQMAQYYVKRNNTNNEGDLLTYNYASRRTDTAFFAPIWTAAYEAILNTNNFIQNVGSPSFNIVPAEEKNLMLGEAIAARALLHFDMLRLFGPVLKVNPQDAAIPYFDRVTVDIQPILPGNIVMEKVLKDLDTALVLLSNDPIISQPLDLGGLNIRKRHLNFYAVKALQARALLHAGKNDAAWSVVQELLPKLDVGFPWDGTSDLVADNPLFIREALFVSENQNMYISYRNLFSSFLEETELYRQSEKRLEDVYSDPRDLRLIKWVKEGSEGNKGYRVFVKYNDLNVKQAFKLLQPLIKKSEIYLMAAELAPDIKEGYNYLNTLKLNRRIPLLTVGSSKVELLKAIQLEYASEFWGEGQLFFLFKRWNLASIPDTENLPLSMTPEKYKPLLPENETFNR